MPALIDHDSCLNLTPRLTDQFSLIVVPRLRDNSGGFVPPTTCCRSSSDNSTNSTGKSFIVRKLTGLTISDIKFFLFMGVFFPIGFIASVHNSSKSKTLIEVYANNVGTSYFHSSSFGLNIFSVYFVPLDRSYVSDLAIKALGI